MKDCIAIIPARGGSRRIPGKNKKLFHGHPIITYSIRTAIQSNLFDAVMVSTDDDDIAKIAMNCEATVIRRQAQFCRDEVGTQDVARHVLDFFPFKKTYACVIYPTAPMMTTFDLKNGFCAAESFIRNFSMSVGCDPLCDAGQFYFGMWEDFGREPLISRYTAMIPIDSKRVCDINTMEDWVRAERMYTELYPERCKA